MRPDFFIAKCDKQGNIQSGSTVNIEQTFTGLKIQNITGLNDKGEPKIFYIEEYVESNQLRTYTDETKQDIERENTTIKMSIFFFGDSRRNSFDTFCDFISKGYNYYWDTLRLKGFISIHKNKVNISQENLYNGVPYFSATFTFTNLMGNTFDVDENGNKL